MAERKASVERDTLETQIKASINLDGTGKARFDIGVPFLEHMLDQIARHGLIDLDVQAQGDLHIDGHHTVEDVGITIGQAVAKAIGDKKGILRYGHAYVPLDEALSRVVIDFSGRPGLVMNVPFKSGMIGTFDTQLAHEFFQGFANHAFVTLHILEVLHEQPVALVKRTRDAFVGCFAQERLDESPLLGIERDDPERGCRVR